MFNFQRFSFVVIIFFSVQIFGQSNNTVTFNGNPASDFNSAEKKWGGDNVDYYITFDSSFLYISAHRVNGSTFNLYDHLHFYLDT